MSQTSAMAASCSDYQAIFDHALEAYRKKTGKDLRSHPLLAKLETCNSPDAVLTALREQISGSGQSGSGDGKFTRWLEPTVNVLFVFSETIANGVSWAYPPAGLIFCGIGVLLSAVKGVMASKSVLVDLFERIEGFFRRLEMYIQVPSNAEMMDTILKIMVEILSILAIATKELNQHRAKRLLKNLFRRGGIEDASQRLDKLTQEEVRMVAAQSLKATHHAEVSIGTEVQGVGDHVVRGVEEVKQQIANEFGNMNRNQLKQDIRNWLSPPDPSVNFNIASDARHKGTTVWFTQGTIFDNWKLSGSLLWIHGKPGSGKSVLSSAIIQNIEGISVAGSAHMSYFFFDFKDTEKQDAHALLTSILIQLGNQCDSFCDILLALYSAHHRGSLQPSDRALVQCLKDMLSIPGQVPIYLVIDALDECPNATGMPSPRDRVLGLVEELVKMNLPTLHLCITSRPEIDIRTSVESLTSNHISLHDQTGQNEDIIDFVSSVVSSDKNMRRWRDEDRISVVESLSARAGGMFRWVFCQLEILRHCLPPSVLSILAELPETLDETYERILQGIPRANQKHAHRLLQCLTVAVRPLEVNELAEVLAIDFSAAGGIPKLKEELRWEDQEQAVLSACSSLIAIVKDVWGRQFVQFSHFSVKEFLTSHRLAAAKENTLCYHHIRLEPAHTIMAKACLGILLQFDYSIDFTSIKSFPLAEYAIHHFGDHVEFENVVSHMQEGIDLFIDAEKPHFATWLWMRVDDHWINDHPQRPEAVPLYYIAEFGFRGLAQHVISRRPQDVNSKVDELGTPLHAALERGHVEVSQLLLGHCVDVDVRGFDEQTPLHLAAYKGSFEVAQMLIQRGADVNAQNKNRQTPLHRVLGSLSDACDDGYFDLLRCLLEHGADVDSQDAEHSTPLHIASFKGSLRAVQILLEHGANPHRRTNEGQTPLHRLLKPLGSTLSDRCSDIIRILLKHGADVDAQDNGHSTPLHMASYKGGPKAVQILLDHGADVHARDNFCQTPLHRSLKGLGHLLQDGYFAVIRILLEHGANIDDRDNDGSTPLHIASNKGNVEAVQILLGHGANIHARDNDGQTSLHRSLKNLDSILQAKYFNVMHILLEHGADVNAPDNGQSTPLHIASFKGSLKAVQTLLEQGANVHARNKDGQTPLHQSLMNLRYTFQIGYFDVMETLLAHGADVDAQGVDRSTPLHLASLQGSHRATQLLLDYGADAHKQDNSGKTPFQVASAQGHQELMSLLSESTSEAPVES